MPALAGAALKKDATSKMGATAHECFLIEPNIACRRADLNSPRSLAQATA
jgi:hypothetical protein